MSLCVSACFSQYEQGQLPFAAANGDLRDVQSCIDAGANVNEQDHRGFTALMNATSVGATNVVKCLLQHKANPNILDEYGTSALFLAAQEKRKDIFQLIVECGGDPKSKHKFSDLTAAELLVADRLTSTEIHRKARWENQEREVRRQIDQAQKKAAQDAHYVRLLDALI